MTQLLSTGNLAIVNGALCYAMEVTPDAGKRRFFAAGYPITPVSDVAEFLSNVADEVGGVFIQAESELAAANMKLGGAAIGVPSFGVTSSPGMSLMQEAISYAKGMELGGRGLVFSNVVRGGPGLGSIAGSQADLAQALTGGHGDGFLLVYTPASAQEAFDLTRAAFLHSARYRTPAFILSDGYTGQLKEQYTIPTSVEPIDIRPVDEVRTSIFVREGVLEAHNWKILQRFQKAAGDPDVQEMSIEEYRINDDGRPADVVLV